MKNKSEPGRFGVEISKGKEKTDTNSSQGYTFENQEMHMDGSPGNPCVEPERQHTTLPVFILQFSLIVSLM